MDERPFYRRLPLGVIPGVVALLALFVGIWLVARPEVEPKRVQEVGPRQRMVDLTNRDRAAHDLEPLKLNRHVSRHAQRHTRQMVNAGTIFHSTPKQLRRALEGFRWHLIGENVGAGGSLESLEDAFMGSPDHRANILNPDFERMAVGVIRAEDSTWVTVIYWG